MEERELGDWKWPLHSTLHGTERNAKRCIIQKWGREAKGDGSWGGGEGRGGLSHPKPPLASGLWDTKVNLTLVIRISRISEEPRGTSELLNPPVKPLKEILKVPWPGVVVMLSRAKSPC